MNMAVKHPLNALALPLRPLGTAASTAPDPDAEVFELYRQWLAAYESYSATEDTKDFNEFCRLQDAILPVPVCTGAGLSIKILVFTNFGEFDLEDEYLDAVLADCERLAGATPPPSLTAHRAMHGSWRHRGPR